MSLSTYAALKAAVLDHLDRDGADWEARVPDFIRLVEADASARLRVRQMVCRATATVSGEYTRLPGDYAGVKSLHIEGGFDAPLAYADPAEMRRLSSLNPAAGRPTHYSLVGTSLQLHPVPDQEYTAEMVVYEDIPALSDASPSNWLLARFPNAYLFGALVFGALFIGEDPRLAGWSAAYDSALDAVRRADATEHTGHHPSQRTRRF